MFVSESDQGGFRAGAYRRSHDLPGDVSAWARLVNTKISVQDEAYFSDLLEAQLVFGWGLTPALIELLHRHGIPFVDFEVDPIRFSDDIFLRVRTNNERLSHYFSLLHIDETAFRTSVAEIRGFVCHKDTSTVVEKQSFGLFAGQSKVDLSIVDSGCVVTPADRIRDIRAVAETVDILLVKPHPYDNDVSHFDLLLNAIPNARITQSNIYRILSDVNLKRVVSLSSSVLDEAALFGIEATRLISPDRDMSDLIPQAVSSWYRIPAEGIASGGLSDVFLGSAPALRNRPARQIDLRRSLNTGWGLPALYAEHPLRLAYEGREPRLRERVVTRRSIGNALRILLTSMI